MPGTSPSIHTANGAVGVILPGLETLLERVLPGSLLLPFHEITELSWNDESRTGRIVAARNNRLDDWFYACHFMGDPVMPGCWGVDAVWQCLRLFAAWRGWSGCDKTLGMEDVRFFGQIRPYDRRVVYSVDIISMEESGGERLLSARADVSVDGEPVYTIGKAQIGTAYWDKTISSPPKDLPPAESPLLRRLRYQEFSSKESLTRAEVLALSYGELIDAPGKEIGLLPSSLMLEVEQVHRLSFNSTSGEGRIVASRSNSPNEWFYPMNGRTKPTALLIDAIWQLLGLFLCWTGNEGTGRALGFERVEVFDFVRPEDRNLLYETRVTRLSRAPNGDAFARADADVFADGRLILSCSGANVGCHRGIRYSGYPRQSEKSLGGSIHTADKENRK